MLCWLLKPAIPISKAELVSCTESNTKLRSVEYHNAPLNPLSRGEKEVCCFKFCLQLLISIIYSRTKE